MQPTFTLIATPTGGGNRNITDTIAARLISLEATDNAGMEIDTMRIVLDNDGYIIEPPSTGATLKLALGYKENVALTTINTFAVDGIAYNGMPHTISITARATEFLGSIKSPRTESWHDTTIGSIVRTIANRNELTPAVSPSLAVSPITHLDQRAQSDMAFLAELAKRYDAVFKIADKRMIFALTGTGTSASGNILPPRTIDLTAISSYGMRIEDRTAYQSAAAEFRTPAGTLEIATAGSGTPAYRLDTIYANKTYANAAATSALRRLQYGKKTITLALPGDAGIFAEDTLKLTGMPQPVATETWIADKVTHSLSADGFTTSISGHAK